ncbi:hypothetical protein DV515_00014613 [Chloebia gouldiae]|uniref:Uncharacterized protein n=1 Tax=Chloebia gouldiae TaxID=44316 RepID=A0A3L8RY39_CHLGU|nr:hypothetical protein DV515_00014613 [Chloebia gouldiae]
MWNRTSRSELDFAELLASRCPFLAGKAPSQHRAIMELTIPKDFASIWNLDTLEMDLKPSLTSTLTICSFSVT